LAERKRELGEDVMFIVLSQIPQLSRTVVCQRFFRGLDTGRVTIPRCRTQAPASDDDDKPLSELSEENLAPVEFATLAQVEWYNNCPAVG
jgi:hypothetical protein